MKQLIDSSPEPSMILNKYRQIVMANDKLEKLLGVRTEEIVGLRPGDALNCIRWREEPGGCGTTRFCRECGAVNATVASQRTNTPADEECQITVSRPDGEYNMDLHVWATPIELHDRFTVFAIRNIGDEKRREVLERMFFHDVLNLAGAIEGLLEMWPDLTPEEAERLRPVMRRGIHDLVDQIQSGRDLAEAERGELHVTEEDLHADKLLTEVIERLRFDQVAGSKQIATPTILGPTLIRTDRVLLGRVLGNLIKNAVEASNPNQTVTATFHGGANPTFSIHNESSMAERIQLQIFQRSFTTKSGKGRGVGTYSVKLLTERYLKGTVTFSSSVAEGTTFRITLPSRLTGE